MQCGEGRVIGTVVEERERRVRGEIKRCHMLKSKVVKFKIKSQKLSKVTVGLNLKSK